MIPIEKPMIKNSNLIGSAKRVAGGGKAAAEIQVNGLVRAAEREAFLSSSRRDVPVIVQPAFLCRAERMSYSSIRVVPQEFVFKVLSLIIGIRLFIMEL